MPSNVNPDSSEKEETVTTPTAGGLTRMVKQNVNGATAPNDTRIFDPTIVTARNSSGFISHLSEFSNSNRRLSFMIYAFSLSYFSTQLCYASDAANAIRLQSKLICQGSIVTISTFCRYGALMDPTYPFCDKQLINISYNNSVNTWVYDYSSMVKSKTDQAFIDGIACFKYKKTDLISFESTDFGNCDECTWYDIFDLRGIYLGSKLGVYAKGNFVPREAESMLEDVVQDPKNRSKEISIFRPKTR